MTEQNEIDSHLMREPISKARVASGEAGTAGVAAPLVCDGHVFLRVADDAARVLEPTDCALR